MNTDERYAAVQVNGGEGMWYIRDRATGSLLRGEFNTREEAEAEIAQKASA